MERFDQELFGIKLFDYQEAQPWDNGIQFIDCKFEFESLKRFDGLPIEVTFEWDIKVWSIEGKLLQEFNIIDVSEFREEILKSMKG
ncbi:hypothetical protein [Paenibacillus oleatilyticus]|uniref:hypothetical protein n=1 Tax=Paenibacillus oleatilyticus TaxID=2594886 RepID=UPI001C1FE59E|nr:hypothetical protein [Paenibacillus oleatilyticus]MBU7316054.1 hypothetical protein [Paenibacillus oleatilyticus]